MIMAAVDIADGCGEFIGVGIIQRGDGDEVKGPSPRPMFATAGSADAAGFAEAVVQVWTRTARRRAH